MASIIGGRESGYKTNPDYKVTLERSPRRVRVKFNGETIADSTSAHLLFETRHLPVYYFPRADVRMDLLVTSDKATACPYKGKARYHSVKIGQETFPDIVWSYPEPIPECPKIKGHLCFFNELVDEIRVDGVAVPRPVTPWSKDWKEKSATVPDTRGPVVRP